MATSLIIYDPDTINTASPDELTRFTCPRQPYDDHLCLADYFASTESGKMDVVAFQVVTVGLEATERFDKLQAAGDYSEAYFTHGLAVQTAEATADYLHEHIRRELGLGEEQGKRYSWGYPAIPDLEDHKKVFELLPAVEKELGMTLSACLPVDPRAVHCRDHCPPQRCQVLQRRRKPGRAVDEVTNKIVQNGISNYRLQ